MKAAFRMGAVGGAVVPRRNPFQLSGLGGGAHGVPRPTYQPRSRLKAKSVSVEAQSH
ncbi:hypothetical protein SBV1_820069 [Verrucomicrobia bacterium]|nr:hypothetical protein SBV1_820069 [Verrucomicrobiota bacterium]